MVNIVGHGINEETNTKNIRHIDVDVQYISTSKVYIVDYNIFYRMDNSVHLRNLQQSEVQSTHVLLMRFQ